MIFSFFSPNTRAQRTECIVAITLSASTPKRSIIIPLPQTAETQELDGAPEFSLVPQQIYTDPIYSNRYGIGEITTHIEERFVIATRPVEKKIDTGWHLSDYRERPQTFLEANDYLAPHDAAISACAQGLRRDTDHLATIITRAYHTTQDLLTYGNPIPGLYTAKEAFEKRLVDCGGYGTLLASLLMACGIPARIVSGFWITPGTVAAERAMHAWVEALLPDGTWLPLDPSVEVLRKAGRSKRRGGLGNIGSDRIITSIGCAIPIEISGAHHVAPILQIPFLYPATTHTLLTTSMTCTRL